MSTELSDELSALLRERFRQHYIAETGRDPDWCGLCGTVHEQVECPPTPPLQTKGLLNYLGRDK